MENLFPFRITVTDGSWLTIAQGLVVVALINSLLFVTYALAVCLVIKAVL